MSKKTTTKPDFTDIDPTRFVISKRGKPSQLTRFIGFAQENRGKIVLMDELTAHFGVSNISIMSYLKKGNIKYSRGFVGDQVAIKIE